MSIFKKTFWLKAGAYSFLQNIANVLFGFGSFYLLVRVFNKPDFGVWALFLSITTIFEQVRIGLVKFGFIKYYTSEEGNEHTNILAASTMLNASLTVVGIAVLSLISSMLSNLWDAQPLQYMLYLYGVNAVLLIPFHQFEFVLHANFQFKGIFVSHFIRGGLFFVFILLSFLGLFGLDLLTLVIVRGVAIMFAVIITYILFMRKYISKKIDFGFNKTNWQWMTKLFNYGKYVTATSISGILYGAIDQFMLGSFINTTSVAIYNTSQRLSNLVNVPTLTIASLVFPYASKISSNSDETSIKNVYEKAVGFNLAVIIIPIILVLLMPELVISIIAGKQYLDAVPLLQIIIIYSLFVPFSRLFGTILDSTGRPNINFYYTLSGLLLNVLLNYFLIQYYSTMGAVLGTLISSIVTFVFMQVYLYKKYGITLTGTIKELFGFYVLSWNTLLTKLKIR